MIVGVAVLPIALVPATLPVHDSGAWSCRMSDEAMEKAREASKDAQIAFFKKHSQLTVKLEKFKKSMPLPLWQHHVGDAKENTLYWCNDAQRLVFAESNVDKRYVCTYCGSLNKEKKLKAYRKCNEGRELCGGREFEAEKCRYIPAAVVDNQIHKRRADQREG